MHGVRRRSLYHQLARRLSIFPFQGSSNSVSILNQSITPVSPPTSGLTCAFLPWPKN